METRTKYVVFGKRLYKGSDGWRREQHIIAFPEYIMHCELAESVSELSGCLEPVSAGFIENGECKGKSISLNLDSRGELDTLLLKKLIEKEK